MKVSEMILHSPITATMTLSQILTFLSPGQSTASYLQRFEAPWRDCRISDLRCILWHVACTTYTWVSTD